MEGPVHEGLCHFQIKDEIKAALMKATQAYHSYVEEPETSQRSERLDSELELRLILLPDRARYYHWKEPLPLNNHCLGGCRW
jgi:hypothetical protein